jgi:23S rRNA G2445 N2-methylase RlmL
MVAKRATVFARNADARIQFDPAKARVALRAGGIVSLHARHYRSSSGKSNRRILESG